MLNFSSLSAVLFDMDGVIYRGKQPLPGVHAVLRFCDEQSIRYACISNNATMTRQQYGEKLAAMHIPISGEQVLGSALATAHYLRSHYPRGTTIYALGMDGLHDALFGDGYFAYQEQQPQLVVQGADMAFGYEKLKIATLAIRAGARFIATNTDRTFPNEEGLVPGSGTLTAILQAATDVEPLVVGKPQPTMFHVALEWLGSTPEATLMIGDRLETDIAGARNAGLPSALVLTGVTSRDQLATSPHQPDGVFDDLEALLEAWKRSRT